MSVNVDEYKVRGLKSMLFPKNPEAVMWLHKKLREHQPPAPT
jgi:hypothetical protein